MTQKDRFHAILKLHLNHRRQFRLSEAAIRFVQELRQLGISLEEAQLALEENFKSEEEKDSFSSLN